MTVLTVPDFVDVFTTLLETEEAPRFGLLVGAGFSATTGIPLACEVAGILAELKLKKLNNKKTGSFSDFLEAWMDSNRDWHKPLEKLISRDPRFGKYSIPEVYTKLFDDPKMFPGSGSRQKFISTLLEVSLAPRNGYNFESLYLSYCLGNSKTLPLRFDTILTTNFDDVIPTAMEKLGITYRMFSDASAIIRADNDASYPKIIYLHGRHTHYDLINTSKELKNPSEIRRQAIARAMSLVADQGGLIICGYAGWEDCVVKELQRCLKEGRFKNGVYWCFYEDEFSIPDKIIELAENEADCTLVHSCSAMKLTKSLMRLNNLSIHDIGTEVDQHNLHFLTDFCRRSIDVRRAADPDRHGWDGSEVASAIKKIDSVRSVDVGLFEEYYELAKSNPAFAQLALEFVRNIRENDSQFKDRRHAGDVFLKRGRLRKSYTQDLEGAISDFFVALESNCSDSVGLYLELYYAYMRLGISGAANCYSTMARDFAHRTNTDFDLGRWEYVEAFRSYWEDEFDDAMELNDSALSRFRSVGDIVWEARCLIRRAQILVYCNEFKRAMDASDQALEVAKNGKMMPQIAEGHFQKARVFLEEARFDDCEQELGLSEEIAVIGPSYLLLGDVARLRSESAQGRRDLEEAQHQSLIANRYYRCSPHIPALELSEMTRQKLFALSDREYSREDYKAFTDVLERYGVYEDLSSLAVQYADLGAALLRKPGKVAPGIIEEVKEASMRVSGQFRENKGVDRDSEAALERENRVAKLAFHVDQYPLLLRMLYNIVIMPDDEEARIRSLKKDYQTLATFVDAFDEFSSPSTEAWAAVVSYRLYKDKVVPGRAIIKYADDRVDRQFQRKRLIGFLRSVGAWQFECFL